MVRAINYRNRKCELIDLTNATVSDYTTVLAADVNEIAVHIFRQKLSFFVLF